MVRVHGSVSPAKTASRLERELTALFGGELFKRAKATDPADLDLSEELMDAVHDAADHLLDHADDPAMQRVLVMALPADVRLVLCMWLFDLELVATLTAMVLNAVA